MLVFSGHRAAALDIYMSAQFESASAASARSVEWDQLEDLATGAAESAAGPDASLQLPHSLPPSMMTTTTMMMTTMTTTGDEDDNDLLLRPVLSSKAEAESEAENKTAPPPLDPKANAELEAFLKSETALDHWPRPRRKASKPSP